jgi:hemerythrin-like domain-containing protein
MEKEEKISVFMLKEHGQILALLTKFNKSKNIEDFKALRKKQEDHMFAEEKAIFTFYKEKKNFPVLTTIMQQHEELEEYMKQIEKDLKRNSEDYKKLMKEHIQLEDKEFYPKLDKDLAPAEQRTMLAKTKEYILGNIGFV